MRKKVLVVNQHYSTGGIKKTLENLMPFLCERYDVNVVFLCGLTDEFSEKFPGHILPSPFVLSSFFSSLKELKKMNLFPIRFVIKCICTLLSKVFTTECIVSCIIKCSKHIGNYDVAIAYAHDNWFDNGAYFGGCNEVVRCKVTALKKVSWLHGEPATIKLTTERLNRSYAGFDTVITVSDACKQQFDTLSDRKIRCSVIRNMYNLEDIKKKTEGILYHKNDEIFRIVTVGRLSKVAKRIDKVNEIARLLKNASYRFDWIVVGDGSEFDECVRICKAYDLESMVHYVGNQSNPYIYMKQSDILVLVSDSEASSMVINESLINGTPVVTTNFQAACESVEDGKNGLICEKDIFSIYEKIVSCIEHPETIRQFRTYISEHPFNNDKSIKALEELIG